MPSLVVIGPQIKEKQGVPPAYMVPTDPILNRVKYAGSATCSTRLPPFPWGRGDVAGRMPGCRNSRVITA